MLATHAWKRLIDTTESADLDNLRRDIVPVINLAMLIIGWFVTLSAILFGGHIEYLPAGLILLIGPAILLWLRLHHFQLALLGSILVMLGGIVCLKGSTPASPTQYLFPVVIVVSSVLVSSLGVLTVAALTAFICLVLTYAQGAGGWDSEQTLMPLALIVLTAGAAWLNSRQVNLALDYTENAYVRARDLLEQLRDERMRLARTHKSLEEAYVRIEKMNYALIEAHRVAEQARQFKSEFVANVSHELRTPLNLIIGFTEMMATAPESYDGIPLPSAYRGDVMAAYRNARHLRALIDDVLDLSRIEAGEMPLNREQTDLNEVIRQAVDMVQSFIEARGLALTCALSDELPLMHIDGTRIRQVLLNLLTNAARFTDRGHVGVSARMENGQVLVAVEDDGRGIDPARLAQAFEAFHQLEDGHAREGSGLGLAVSKRFVELHGGSMWIESEVGRGSKVYFTLPPPSDLHNLSSYHWVPGRTRSQRTEEPTVLVLHDDVRVLPLLRRHVGGYQYQIAETADKARAMIHATLPAAVIVDTNWWASTVQSVRDLDLPPRLPRIQCSLPSAQHFRVLVGATDFLTKPVTREDLNNAIARLSIPARTVLVVDDERDFVRLMERMLKADHPSLRVLESFGGKQGLEILRAERPDLVLLDLMMPEVDGYAFLATMARDAAMANTRVIVISAPSPDLEMTQLPGELRLECKAGFSLTEMLQALDVNLAMVTRRSGEVPAKDARPLRVGPD